MFGLKDLERLNRLRVSDAMCVRNGSNKLGSVELITEIVHCFGSREL